MTAGCANTVQYGEDSRVEEIRTDVGTSDLMMACQRMIAKMLSDNRVRSLTENNRPQLAVDPLVDQTMSNLNLSPLHISIWQQLEQNGRFGLIDPKQAQKTRIELTKLLDFNAISDKAAQAFAENVQTDLLLYGTISHVVRTRSNSREVFYRLNLNLWDAKQQTLIWQDESEHLKSRRRLIFGI
jgi:uncharacterized protein (TIGR02722 family)